MTIGERIKHMREHMGISQVSFADKINVSKQTLYKYENNIITNIPSDKIEAIAELCHVSPSYIMGWDDPSAIRPLSTTYSNIYEVDTQKIPMLGSVSCGVPKFANMEYESYTLKGTGIKCDFCLRASGDSMIGIGIHDGDIVFCRQQSMVDNGEIAVVIIGDEVTLKRFYYYRDQNMIILRPENPNYPEQVYSGQQLEEVHVLGKAIASLMDVK